MHCISFERTRWARKLTFSSTVALLVLIYLLSPNHFATAAIGNGCNDTTDDFFIFSPNLYNATSCYQTADHSSNDVTRISWANVSGDYYFNFTFQENVNLSSVDVFLLFYANGTYTSADAVPPYGGKYTFFVHLNVTNTRVCHNSTHQRLITPVVIGEKTAQVKLSSTYTYIITSIPNIIPMDQWFCVGLSCIVVEGGLGFDYINWPQRAYNDQLWLPDDMAWIYYVMFGAIAAGVLIVVSVVMIRKKKKGPNVQEDKP